MGILFGFALMVAGAVYGGFYLGLYCGITQIVAGVSAVPVIGEDIAIGIIKVLLAGLMGFALALPGFFFALCFGYGKPKKAKPVQYGPR